MADAIVVMSAVVSVLALIGSVVILASGPSRKRVARTQASALRSASQAERAADRVLASLAAISERSRFEVQADPEAARTVIAYFAAGVEAGERSSEHLLSALRAEKILDAITEKAKQRRFEFEVESAWVREVRRSTASPDTPWWVVEGKPIKRSSGDDDAWNNTGAVPSMV